jgi:hypothetical protein
MVEVLVNCLHARDREVSAQLIAEALGLVAEQVARDHRDVDAKRPLRVGARTAPDAA